MTNNDTDAKKLSPALENYLEAIFLLEMSEGAARASAIADAAGVSRSTVTSALKVLKKLKLVEYSPYSLVYLTEEGKRIGRDISHRHLVFQEFFEKVLQLETGLADRVACDLEHVVPAEVIRRLGQFVLFLKSRSEAWAHWQDDYLREEIARHSHVGPQLPAPGRGQARKGDHAAAGPDFGESYR